jgi:uncharacterized membrane protein YphA (DoxX/SURF4 family)
MPTDPPSPEPRQNRTPRPWAAILVRFALGGLFLYMGLSKALDPVDFLKLVRQYDFFSHHYLLNLTAACLPWFEVFCGLLLISGLAIRGTSLVIILMLIPFTWLVANRAMDIADLKHLPFCAVRFDCGCGAGEVNICAKIAENTALTLAATWLLLRRRPRLD